MKQPGRIVHHLGDDYLCLEGGYNPASRTVTLLCAGDNGSFPQRDETQPLTWLDQGEWYPVARWSTDDLLLPDPRHREQREVAAEIVERYLDEEGETPEAAWAVSDGKGFRATLVEVMPQGVACELHESEEAALEAADGETVVPVHDVARFFTHLAREGYAGVMWNALLPVFFCVDEEGELQFLRVADGGGGKVAMEILDAVEGWLPYDGEQAIDFLDNADACDARLVESVGHLPLLDWPDDEVLWSMGPREGAAGVVTVAEDGLDYVLLFTDEAACSEWVEEEIEEEWTAFSIPDLRAFLEASSAEGAGCLLNPGAHRARRGVLWRDGERIVLDSFSGFWELTDEGFAVIDDIGFEAEGLGEGGLVEPEGGFEGDERDDEG